jgi:hypothetical protein
MSDRQLERLDERRRAIEADPAAAGAAVRALLAAARDEAGAEGHPLDAARYLRDLASAHPAAMARYADDVAETVVDLPPSAARVRRSLVAGLRAIAETSPAVVERAVVADALDDVLDVSEGERPATVCDALRAWASAGESGTEPPREVVDRAVEALGIPDAEVQEAAVRVVEAGARGEATDPTPIEALLATLDQSEGSVRRRALFALARTAADRPVWVAEAAGRERVVEAIDAAVADLAAEIETPGVIDRALTALREDRR